MTPKIPIPTDNLYKFAAILGLVLMVTAFTLATLTANSTEQTINTAMKNNLELTSASMNKDAKSQFYDGLISKAEARKDSYIWPLLTLVVLSTASMTYGFFGWRKIIQPLDHAIQEQQKRKLELENARAELENTKLELEVLALRNQAGSDSPDTGENSTAS